MSRDGNEDNQRQIVENAVSHTITPISFVREAIRAVPAVKWALGVGGIMAVIAIVYSFQIDPRVAVIGTVILLVFMSVLVLFARASAFDNSTIALPSLVFTWFALLIFVAVTLSLFTSVFFQMPIDLRFWITGQNTSVTSDGASTDSKYEKAAKNALDKLDSFKLPAITSPQRSQLFARGHMIRSAIPSVEDLRSAQEKLKKTQSEFEKTVLTDQLERTLSIERDADKWYVSVLQAGCI